MAKKKVTPKRIKPPPFPKQIEAAAKAVKRLDLGKTAIITLLVISVALALAYALVPPATLEAIFDAITPQ